MAHDVPARSLSPWAVVALASCVGALAGAAAVLLWQEAAGAAAATAGPTVVGVDTMQARFERLERELGQLQMAPVPVQADAAVREPVAPVRDEALHERVARLEHQVGQLAGRELTAALANVRLGVPDAHTPPPPRQEQQQQQRELQQQLQQAAHTVVLDPRASTTAKLAAWQQLRNIENSWNDAVVATMVHVGATDADAAVRADVWRQADGRSTHPEMARALLAALANDPDAMVRDEAAETLENYNTDPIVRQALEHAAANDADASVRRRAQQSLQLRK